MVRNGITYLSCYYIVEGGEMNEYEKDHKIMVEYLLLCVRLKDWHGVSDAANDLRVMEAAEKEPYRLNNVETG